MLISVNIRNTRKHSSENTTLLFDLPVQFAVYLLCYWSLTVERKKWYARRWKWNFNPAKIKVLALNHDIGDADIFTISHEESGEETLWYSVKIIFFGGIAANRWNKIRRRNCNKSWKKYSLSKSKETPDAAIHYIV